MKGFRLNYTRNDLRKKVNLIDLSILTNMIVLILISTHINQKIDGFYNVWSYNI